MVRLVVGCKEGLAAHGKENPVEAGNEVDLAVASSMNAHHMRAEGTDRQVPPEEVEAARAY